MYQFEFKHFLSDLCNMDNGYWIIYIIIHIVVDIAVGNEIFFFENHSKALNILSIRITEKCIKFQTIKHYIRELSYFHKMCVMWSEITFGI